MANETKEVMAALDREVEKHRKAIGLLEEAKTKVLSAFGETTPDLQPVRSFNGVPGTESGLFDSALGKKSAAAPKTGKRKFTLTPTHPSQRVRTCVCGYSCKGPAFKHHMAECSKYKKASKEDRQAVEDSWKKALPTVAARDSASERG